MKRKVSTIIKEHELYVVSIIIGLIFIGAMAMVAWMFRTSIAPPPYQELADEDLQKVFATGYLRFREDNGVPYLKIEVHNGGQWWIRKIQFDFNGRKRTLVDPEIFKPLSFGAMRLILEEAPPDANAGQEYDINIKKAFGYPPADEVRSQKRHMAETRGPDSDQSGRKSKYIFSD
jgi:hypothetical protein